MKKHDVLYTLRMRGNENTCKRRCKSFEESNLFFTMVGGLRKEIMRNSFTIYKKKAEKGEE